MDTSRSRLLLARSNGTLSCFHLPSGHLDYADVTIPELGGAALTAFTLDPTRSYRAALATSTGKVWVATMAKEEEKEEKED